MDQGLSTSEAKNKLLEFGPNSLPEKSNFSVVTLFVSQFKNILSLILITASVLSFLVGDQIDGILILIILFLNSLLGFWQEFKASKELAALKRLEVVNSRVLRDGNQVLIPSHEIVPGDIVILEAGDQVPADGQIVEAYELSLNEASLTGESAAVNKSSKNGENELFLGTTVLTGRAKLLIQNTGVKTKFGQIALTLSTVKEKETPLEISLSSLSKRIGILVVVISIILLIFNLFSGIGFLESLFSSIALLVAAVPEGLPTVITVLLAIGVHNMYKNHTLIRKLSAIESLGATNIICTDKTGTLTKNEMSVTEIEISSANLKLALLTAILCNTASIVLKEDQPLNDQNTKDRQNYNMLGDTTEGALLFWAMSEGLDIDQIRNSGKVIEEAPFNLTKRMMSVLWQDSKTHAVTQYSKGAPEVILSICDLSDKKRTELAVVYQKMAEKGLRVLALALHKSIKDKKIRDNGLDFLGFVGIADPPRIEAKEAIFRASAAGIRVVMVTGDNELTAKYIASEVGIFRPGDEVITGSEIEKLTDQELQDKLSNISVFARIQPESKLRIVQALQNIGKVVTVTGDGVNDALALKQAHVGVAMGITGTSVAKEAADMVILDDNLSTIVTAVSEGRLIYNNILKVVKFLLTGNLSELLLILLAVFAGLPSPLLPVQLLWINLVTDGLPALSLVADKAPKDIMNRPPRSLSEPLLSWVNIRYIVVFGVLIAIVNIFAFSTVYLNFGIEAARSLVFSFIVVSQMVFLFILRGKSQIFSNRYLLFSILLVFSLQAAIIYFEPLKAIFKL